MMIATTRRQKKYDHRLKSVVRTTGRTDLAREYGVPESTARGWIVAPQSEVVTSNVNDLEIVRAEHHNIWDFSARVLATHSASWHQSH
jgi:hypothetical protein